MKTGRLCATKANKHLIGSQIYCDITTGSEKASQGASPCWQKGDQVSPPLLAFQSGTEKGTEIHASLNLTFKEIVAIQMLSNTNVESYRRTSIAIV